MAGNAASARPPPFTFDIFFRMTLSSVMVDPCLARVFVTHSFSVSEMESNGVQSSADPPEMMDEKYKISHMWRKLHFDMPYTSCQQILFAMAM